MNANFVDEYGVMNYENAKQVERRDALHTAFVKDLPPGMSVTYYETEFDGEHLYVFMSANFDRLPTMDTERRQGWKIGIRGGAKMLNSFKA